MNISYFKTFIIVVEKGRFSDAAKTLGLSQPAISFQIQALERHFKDTLMERSSGHVILTPTGEVFLKFAKKIIDEYDELHLQIEKMSRDVTGRLVLEASTIPGEYIVPKIIGQFSKRFPIVDVSMTISDSKIVIDHILDRSIDIGFIGALPTKKHPHLKSIDYVADELVVVVPPDHPLGTKKSVRIRESLSQPWVLRESGSGTRKTFTQALEKAGLSEQDLTVGMELSSNQAILSAVEAGLGISILSKWVANKAQEVKTVKVLPVADLDLNRRLYMVYNDERQITRPQEAFIKVALTLEREGYT